jgi:hypothetical protein
MQNYYIIVFTLIIVVSLFYGLSTNEYQDGYSNVYNNNGNRMLGNVDINHYGTGNVITGGNSWSSVTRYDPNNYDTIFHQEFKDKVNASLSGNIVYYQPGSFRYNTSSYVPYYEDSVFLTRSNKAIVNAPTYMSSTAQGGFCSYYGVQPNMIEEKCNAIDGASCAATTCCVLLGGQKCVSGNQAGPTMKANYSDFLVRNKDFYYYQGKCYGNCPSPNLPVPTLPPPPPQNMPPLPPQGMVIGTSA